MTPIETKVPWLAALIVAALTTRADAHAFKSGAEGYAQFLEGTSIIFAYPGTLLPIAATGIMAGLWHADGMVRAFPIFGMGLLLGFVLSVFVGPQVVIWLIVLGVVTATLAALLRRHSALLCLPLAFASGTLVMMVSLEGHSWFELSVFINAGVFLAAALSFVFMANLTRMAIERFPGVVAPIVFRVAASWIAAMLLLFLAFAWRG